MQKKQDVDLTHMPQYIKQAPWYLDQKDQPVLTHQRARNDGTKAPIDTWYRRGEKVSQQVTKYRKGACTNCGAMTHSAKTCTERPRKLGAKYTQKDFAQDEVIEQVQLDYEGKRDRWNGYDPANYKFVIEEWNNLNDEQKKIRAQQLEEKLKRQAQEGDENENQEDSASSEDSDPDKEKGEEDQNQFANKDPRVRTTIRNLRIREDIAKYLRNLDPNSAPYDGKSRMMKENPNPTLPESMQQFKGDNFAKFSGDYMGLLNQEGFMLEATQVGGVDVNNVAMPSQVEILHKQFKEKKEQLKTKKMQELLGKYGGEQHLKIPDEMKDLIVVPEDVNHASGNHNKLINSGNFEIKQIDFNSHNNKGLIGIKSKYEEDVHVNGHSSVWGSYWHNHFGWGFKCCYSFDKRSKCRGEEGKVETIKKEYEQELQVKKAQEEEQKRYVEEQNRKYLKQDGKQIAESKNPEKQQEKQETIKQKEKEQSSESDQSSSSSESESNSSSDDEDSYKSDDSGPRNRKKKREAKRSQKEQKKDSKINDDGKNEKGNHRQKYNSFKADEPVTQEELENYQRKRQMFDDPMRNYKK